jgi:hypothetical protein
MDQSGFVGEYDGLDAVSEIELLEDAGDVCLGRVFAHVCPCMGALRPDICG